MDASEEPKKEHNDTPDLLSWRRGDRQVPLRQLCKRLACQRPSHNGHEARRPAAGMLPAMNAMHKLAAVDWFHIVACMRWDGHERVHGCWLYSEHGRGSECEAGRRCMTLPASRISLATWDAKRLCKPRRPKYQHAVVLTASAPHTSGQHASDTPARRQIAGFSNVHRAVALAVNHRIPTESSVARGVCRSHQRNSSLLCAPKSQQDASPPALLRHPKRAPVDASNASIALTIDSALLKPALSSSNGPKRSPGARRCGRRADGCLSTCTRHAAPR